MSFSVYQKLAVMVLILSTAIFILLVARKKRVPIMDTEAR